MTGFEPRTSGIESDRSTKIIVAKGFKKLPTVSKYRPIWSH